MNRKITARAIIIDDTDKLFCVRLKAYGGKSERDFWCTPGGGINDAESLQDALVREMIEETGITPVVGALLYVQQFIFEGEEQLEFFFHVTNSSDYKQIDLSKASHADEEIAELGFVDPTKTHLLPKFLTEEPVAQHIKSLGQAKVISYL